MVPVAASTAAFEDLLMEQEFVAKFFDVQLVGELLRSGQTLAAGELFGFKRLPALGGEYVVDNFEPTDIEVHFGVSGQLQAKVSRLEPGTVVRSVTIGNAGHSLRPPPANT
ncbi:MULTISPECIES: T6SS immunity protein Tdi1 domain-containing protein [unclassified Variovorax]|uniref:T6SS immunity protein Tdi1 domain-containing protein n=1 Tax=unclassified Variovorax TaxID=663243 RepID=UPI003ECC4FFD